MRLSAIVLSVLFISISVASSAPAQEDPLDRLRQVPPSYQNDAANESTVILIDWQLHLKEELRDRYEDKANMYANEATGVSNRVREIAGSLPVELRFADANNRSRLVGLALEELFSARLEIATQEQTIAMLEAELLAANDNSADSPDKQSHQLKVESAEMKVELAKSEYETIQALHEKQAQTTREVQRAKYSFNLANLELQEAILQLELAKGKSGVEIADRLAQARIAVRPIKARIATIEKFLEQIAEVAEKMAGIEALNRRSLVVEQWTNSFRNESAVLGREIDELQVLKQAVVEQMDETKKRNEKKSDHNSDQNEERPDVDGSQ